MGRSRIVRLVSLFGFLASLPLSCRPRASKLDPLPFDDWLLASIAQNGQGPVSAADLAFATILPPVEEEEEATEPEEAGAEAVGGGELGGGGFAEAFAEGGFGGAGGFGEVGGFGGAGGAEEEVPEQLVYLDDEGAGGGGDWAEEGALTALNTMFLLGLTLAIDPNFNAGDGPQPIPSFSAREIPPPPPGPPVQPFIPPLPPITVPPVQ
ncbi:MAG: hypothetical protein HOV80_06000, partial [Polyangiaceae bacterium]|nr:hypothetical protein [Polyangiaceae bacterium]